MNIDKSQALPKETWMTAADNLGKVAPFIAEELRKTNFEGQGKEDAEEFITDMQLAIMALYYVANCATDKCRVIPVSPKDMN